MAMGRLFGLNASTVISGITLAYTIITHITDDSEECIKWEVDEWTGWEVCTEWGAPSFPIFATILWVAMLGMTGTMLYLPKFRYQFD